MLSVCPADSWGGAVLLSEGPEEDSHTPSRYSRIRTLKKVLVLCQTVRCKFWGVSVKSVSEFLPNLSPNLIIAQCERALKILWCMFSYSDKWFPFFVCSDLVKHVVKEYRNIYPEIMKRASRTFDQVCSVWEDQWQHWNQLNVVILKKYHIPGHNFALF